MYVCVLYVSRLFIILFFKQKTAYEMRISDWSSDVCSSDLFTHRTMCQKGIVLSRASRYDLEVRPLFDQRGAGSVEILADGIAMEAQRHCSDTHISSPFTATL